MWEKSLSKVMPQWVEILSGKAFVFSIPFLISENRTINFSWISRVIKILLLNIQKLFHPIMQIHLPRSTALWWCLSCFSITAWWSENYFQKFFQKLILGYPWSVWRVKRIWFAVQTFPYDMTPVSVRKSPIHCTSLEFFTAFDSRPSSSAPLNTPWAP